QSGEDALQPCGGGGRSVNVGNADVSANSESVSRRACRRPKLSVRGVHVGVMPRSDNVSISASFPQVREKRRSGHRKWRKMAEKLFSTKFKNVDRLVLTNDQFLCIILFAFCGSMLSPNSAPWLFPCD